MSDLHTIEVHLTTQQLKKLKNNQTFQLNTKQFYESVNGHKVKLVIGKKHHARFQRNLKNNKGFRFTKDIVEGAGFFDNITSVWNTIKPYASQAANLVKDYVPRDLIKSVAKKGVQTILPKSAQDVTTNIIDKGIDYGYDTKKKDALHHIADLATIYSPEIQQGVKKVIGGSIKKKFVKGSPEAREWGKRMQQARLQKKNGKGIIEDIGHLVGFGVGEKRKRKSRKIEEGEGFFDSFKKILAPALPELAKFAGKEIGKLAGGEKGAQIGEAVGSAAGDIGKSMIGGRVKGGSFKGLGVKGGSFAALGSGLKQRKNKVPYCTLIDGVPKPVITEKELGRILTHGLNHHNRGKNGLKSGGSFLSL